MKSIVPRSAKLRLRTLVVATIVGLAAGLILASSGSEAKGKIGKLPKEATARRQLAMLDGRQFSLASLRGQVVVLNFFAVWCGHSRDHIPALTRFKEEDWRRGLQIIGLAVQDQQTTSERLHQFIKDQQIAYPVGWVSDRLFSEFVQARDVSVPQTLVYSRDGRLAGHFLGQSTGSDAALVALIARELEKQ
jgi:thiol-disulfide isomerase/thioredoxin